MFHCRHSTMYIGYIVLGAPHYGDDSSPPTTRFCLQLAAFINNICCCWWAACVSKRTSHISIALQRPLCVLLQSRREWWLGRRCERHRTGKQQDQLLGFKPPSIHRLQLPHHRRQRAGAVEGQQGVLLHGHPQRRSVLQFIAIYLWIQRPKSDPKFVLFSTYYLFL